MLRFIGMSNPKAPDGLTTRLSAWLARSARTAEMIVVLPGDISPRRYARVTEASGATAIAAYYPESVRAAMRRYSLATELMGDAKVRVPRILLASESEGFMLVEDLGPATVFEKAAAAAPAAITAWFAEAVKIVASIQTIPPNQVSALNPPLDGAWLARELEQTWDSFLTPRGLAGSLAEAQALRTALGELCAALGRGEQVVCHRDFMVRNLIPTDHGLAVIDHQDTRLGPVAYDLASLLNDSWFPPDELEARCVTEVLSRAAGEGTRADYDRAAAQRTLKAVGSFARAAANGSAKHEALIAPTMERALRNLARAPETRSIAVPLSARWHQHLLD